jgi:hypothetical protein
VEEEDEVGGEAGTGAAPGGGADVEDPEAVEGEHPGGVGVPEAAAGDDNWTQ